MADFELIVGIDQQLSYKNFENGIEEIIKNLNNKKYEIDVRLGGASVSGIKEDLQNAIREAFKGVDFGTAESKMATGSFGNGILAALADIRKDIQATTAEFQGLSKSIDAISKKKFNLNTNINLDKDKEELDAYKAKVASYLSDFIVETEAAKRAFASFTGKFEGDMSKVGVAIKFQVDDWVKEIKRIETGVKGLSSFKGLEQRAADALPYWKELADMVDKMKNAGVDVSGITIPTMPKMPSIEDRAPQSGVVNQLASALQSMNGIASAGPQATRVIESQTAATQALTESQSTATRAIESHVAATQKSADVADSNAAATARERDEAIKLAAALREADATNAYIGQRITATDSTLGGLTDERRAAAAADVSEKYRELIMETERLRASDASASQEQIANLRTKQTALKEMIDALELESAAAQRSAEAERQKKTNEQAETYSKAEAALRRYYDLQTKLTSIQGQMKLPGDVTQDQATGQWSSASGRLSEYAQKLNDAYSAYKKYVSGLREGAVSQSQKIKLTELEINLEKALSDAIMKAALTQKSAEELKAKAQAKQNDTIKKAEALLTRINSGIMNWTKAKHGTSSGAYTSLGTMFNDLSSSLDALKRGEITVEALEGDIKRVGAAFQGAAGEIKAAGENTQSFNLHMSGLVQKLTAMFSIQRVISLLYRSIKQMVSATIELDSALTTLQIVTNESDVVMSKFGDTALEAADRLGASATDFISGATTYARLGFSLEESSALSEYTTMLQNVGNIDTQDAQDAVTAIIKAFSDEVDINNIESVMDRLVTVGNNFPISVSQIATGMNNASSALHAGGNSLNESVALLTAANTTVQNASKASTGLRTITARLRNTKADLDELGEDMTEAKYEELISALTDVKVSLTDINGEYKSTYEIMSELAGVWDELGSQRQAALATQIAGTRQQDVFFSIINNFKEAQNAMKMMEEESDGALGSAYEKYLNTATAHINEMKNAFVGLAKTLISSGTVSYFADLAKNILNCATWLQKYHVLIPAIAGAYSAMKIPSFIKQLKETDGRLKTITTSIVKNKGATNNLTETLSKLTNNQRKRIAADIEANVLAGNLSKEEGAAAKSALALSAADDALASSEEKVAFANRSITYTLKELFLSNPIGWIMTIVSLIGTLVANIKQGREEAKQAAQEAREKQMEAADAAADEAKSIVEAYQAYVDATGKIDGVKKSKEEMNSATDAVLERLKLERDGVDELSKKYGELDSAIVQATVDGLKKKASDAASGKYSAKEGAVEYFKDEYHNNFGWDDRFIYTPIGDSYETAIWKKAGEIGGKIQDAINSAFGWEVSESPPAGGLMIYTGFKDLKDIDTFDEVMEYYQRLEAVRTAMIDGAEEFGYTFEELASTEIFKEIDNELRGLSDYITKVESYEGDVASSLVSAKYIEEYSSSGNIPKTASEFEKMEEAIKGAVYANSQYTGSLEDLDGYVEDTLSTYPELRKFYNELGALDRMVNSADINGAQGRSVAETRRFAEQQREQIKNDLLDRFGGDLTGLGDLSDIELNYVYEIIVKDGSISLDEAIEKAKGLAEMARKSDIRFNISVFEDVQSLSEGLDKLKKIYADVQDGGDFDWSSILNNDDFEKVFGGFEKEYSALIETIAKSPGDIDACQQAFNNLASAYINAGINLEDLTEDTKDGYVAILKSLGVTNAAEIAEKALAYQKERSALASENLTAEQAMERWSTLDVAEADDVARKALADYILQKINANNTVIKTSADVQNIIDLANAAGAGVGAIARLTKAKLALAEAETIERQAAESGVPLDYNAMRHMTSTAYATIDSVLNGTFNWDVWFNVNDYLHDGKNGGGYGVGFGGGSDSSGGSSGGGGTTDSDNWFKEAYAEWQHNLNMGMATQQAYYDWLSWAFEQANKEGLLTLEEYRKYAEEVFKLQRTLFTNQLSEIDQMISNYDNFDGDIVKKAELLAKEILMIEAEMADVRAKIASGELVNADDYLNELQKKWNSAYKSYQDLHEKIESEAQKNAQKLIDLRIKMLKQEIKDQRDAIKKQLDALKDFYDKQKKMLDDAKDEDKYLEEQSEKRMAVTKLEMQLRALEADDSAWAAKKKLELREDLAKAQKELDDFERDHAIETAKDQLDEMYELQKSELEAQDELLEKQENDAKALYEQALADIKNGSIALYEEMINYNNLYGDGIQQTITDMWESAYDSLKKYYDLNKQFYEDIVLANVTGATDGESFDDMAVSGNGTKSGTEVERHKNSAGGNGIIPGDIDGDGKVTAADARLATRLMVGHTDPEAKYPMAGDLDGDGKITAADARRILLMSIGLDDGYASGTSSASSGIHEIDELGSETIFESADGRKYKLFTGGEKVLSAKASDFLYRFATRGAELFDRMFGTPGSTHTPAFAGAGGIAITQGDIIIEGNADRATVSEIRRAQRDSVNYMLKELTRLQR